MTTTFMGYSHDDRPMYWIDDGEEGKIAYGPVVTEGIGLSVGDIVKSEPKEESEATI